MACKNVCKLCDKLVISSAVTFTGGNLVINLPAGNYGDGCACRTWKRESGYRILLDRVAALYEERYYTSSG